MLPELPKTFRFIVGAIIFPIYSTTYNFLYQAHDRPQGNKNPSVLQGEKRYCIEAMMDKARLGTEGKVATEIADFRIDGKG